MSALPQDQTIPITLNGRGIAALAGETLIETAKRHGIEIPHLCYMEGMRPDGNFMNQGRFDGSLHDRFITCMITAGDIGAADIRH